MVYLHHGQNLHIHAVRANILMSFSVDFENRSISTDFDTAYRPPNMAGVYIVL